MKTEHVHVAGESRPCCDKVRTAAYIAGLGGALFVMLFLVWLMYRYNRPADVNRQQRAEERKKALTDLRAADTDLGKSYGWSNKDLQITRLPIDKAMTLTLEQWKNPAAARSNLVQRAEKAFPPPPPPPKSEFE